METSYSWLEWKSWIVILISSFNILKYIYEENLVSQQEILYAKEYITLFTSGSFLIGN